MKEQLNLKEFSKLTLYYTSALKQLETELNIINQEFEVLSDNNPINHIKTRIKTIASIVEKLKRKDMDISVENMFELGDVVGARVVCNFIDDIYVVLDRIKQNKMLNIIEEKDYIKNPKVSGYRGYHIILSMPIVINGDRKDIKVEIQLRTTAMDFWASSEHRLNYKAEGISLEDQEELKNAAEEVWHIDLSMNDLAKKQRNSLKTESNDMRLKIIDSFMNRRANDEVC